jgi:hypothetical protein
MFTEMNTPTYLDKIRRKKTKVIKKKLCVFDSLMDYTPPPTPQPVNPVLLTQDARIRLDFGYLKAKVDYALRHHQKVKLGRLHKYVYYAGRLKEPVPEEIFERIRSSQPPPMRKKKHKKNRFKPKKPTRKQRGRKEYDNYLKSPIWKDIKKAYFATHDKKCAICGASRRINLHHMYYSDSGTEQPEHLIPLCETHHEALHKHIGKSHKDMIQETTDFITQQRLI